MFLLPALGALATGANHRLRPDGTRLVQIDPVWFFVLVILTFLAGLRFEVGGDWRNYFRYLYAAGTMTFADVTTREDPGYWALNILSNQYDWGIFGVNTMGAFFFALGVVVFCRSLPRPWLALATAVPYLVIVVGMGYTRQSIAIGLVMIGFVALGRQRYVSFALWVLLAALFHKTAVILIPLAGLTVAKNRVQIIGLIAVATTFGYFTLLQENVDQLINTYVYANIQSSGVLIRLSMNAVPAVLLLILRRRFVVAPAEYRLWMLVALLSLAMFLVFFALNLSTALDRMALYFIPLQLVIFAHIPDMIGRPGGENSAIVATIILYYASVLFVWLNFADHSSYWIPYKMGFF